MSIRKDYMNQETQVVYDLAMWAIDNDAELMQELAEKYFSSLEKDDLLEMHERLCD